MAAGSTNGSRWRVADDAVLVQWLKLDGIQARLWGALYHCLDEREQDKADKFYFESDRQSYVATHALLRLLLSHQVCRSPNEWRYVINEYGKPQLANDGRFPPLTFSISHTRGLAAVAMSLQSEIGVDVERIEAVQPDVLMSSRVLTASEIGSLRNKTPRERLQDLCCIWTLKEACVKAMGKGLHVPLQDLAVDLDAVTVSFSTAVFEEPSCWMFHQTRPTQHHVLGLAVKHAAARTVKIQIGEVSPPDLGDL